MPFALGKIHRGSVLGALSLLALSVTLGGCENRPPVRVKMTATVESGDVAYTGSSVQEYRCRPSSHVMNDLSNCRINGEAVVVDIKGKGVLFLIFDMPGARSITEMPRSVLGAVSADPMNATQETLPKSWTLQPAQMPLMVKFDNLADAYTVREVNPTNLEASFGASIKSISVKMETTDEPVTHGNVQRYLPWISDEEDHFNKNSPVNPLSESLSKSRFEADFN